jgi:hypothetical protein
MTMGEYQPDFTVSDHGSIFLLSPLTEEAHAWAQEFLPEDTPMWGASYAIEHRYIDPIIEGIEDAVLIVQGE